MKFYLLIILFLVFINGCSSERNLCFNENCFLVEVADTESERKIGLMYREYLDENQGMLFIFENEGFHGFWMKDTLIPLDIIWINSDKQVVFIRENVLPCKEPFEKSSYGEECEVYKPGEKAKYVLEINSEKVRELGIKIGDKVEF